MVQVSTINTCELVKFSGPKEPVNKNRVKAKIIEGLNSLFLHQHYARLLSFTWPAHTNL